MSCTYYHWDDGWACYKIGKNVNDDIYYKYCRYEYYDYSDCPIYKAEDNSSGCFLTSACVEAMGLSDDCYELTTLRNYRDTYLKNAPDGACDICEYYAIAPKIVEVIKSSTDALSVFKCIYDELVIPCVKLIEAGRFAETHEKYKAYTFMLKEEYLNI